MTWVVVIALVLIWTVVRELLMDKYAPEDCPDNLRNTGIITGVCFIVSLILMVLFL